MRLELYGGGDAVDSVLKRANELGLAEHLSMSGVFLPHRDVLEHVSSASVGVIPNLPSRLNRFALSTKLFEYVALGVPVVSADLPTIREHFSEAEIAFFRAGDVDSLAIALLGVADDRAAAVARTRAALKRYERYRWSEQSRRYAEILHRCVLPAKVT
jgi:glycosyltransferase involved in cell wall biosynthesis